LAEHPGIFEGLEYKLPGATAFDASAFLPGFKDAREPYVAVFVEPTLPAVEMRYCREQT
jgi:hypothetical protein